MMNVYSLSGDSGTLPKKNPYLLQDADLKPADRPSLEQYEGTSFSRGVITGQIVVYNPEIKVRRTIYTNPSGETARFVAALEKLVLDLDRLAAEKKVVTLQETREVIGVFQMLSRDRGWQERVIYAIEAGLAAEVAVERVLQDIKDRFLRSGNAYLQERVVDFEDLSRRVIRHLTGDTQQSLATELPENTILLAENLGPAELLEADRGKVSGIILNSGSASSHVSIIARSLGMPMIGNLGLVELESCEGKPAILDAEDGVVFLSPPSELLERYRHLALSLKGRTLKLAVTKDQPLRTRDGVEVDLRINVSFRNEASHLERNDVGGIGLVRTEFMFMEGQGIPSHERQVDCYRSIYRAARNKPVVFRALDIGGDKTVPYLAPVSQANPSMGWRGVRVLLDKPEILRSQLRALIDASSGKHLRVLFPMVSNVGEFRQAHDILQQELDRCAGHIPSQVSVGAMLEVPALVWQLDKLLPLVDFLSVGSNDLQQFFFAQDRENALLEGRYDPLCPAVLLMLRHIADKCGEYRVPLSFCGEIASSSVGVMALLGVGLRSFSVSPSSVGILRNMVTSLNLTDFNEYLAVLLQASEDTVRRELLEYAEEHDVFLGPGDGEAGPVQGLSVS